ncbi:hypothetical protein [Streptomyces sp. RFCAC02]|uniref:hypothetical protein n=1 Tax=Streptomyces sp. RFCAC02 TaxID=2499143 RepID=UPI00101ECDA3|nr:hypothetical protein [Streptomyces sp. RFCAC02]
MSNRADDNGTDVEIYRVPLSRTIRVETPTGAPPSLLDLLDTLGFERQGVTTSGPVYTWHEVPAALGEQDVEQLLARACVRLVAAGHVTHIDRALLSRTALNDALAETRRRPNPVPAPHGPAGPALPPARHR